MFDTLQHILETSLRSLALMMTTYAPPLLAALTLGLAAYVLASLARWVLSRIFKGAAVDRFLSQSGLSSMLTRSGALRARKIVAGAAFWLIFGAGVLMGIEIGRASCRERV